MTSQNWHFSYFFVTKQLDCCSQALYLYGITNPKSRRGWQPCLAINFLDENLSTVNRKLSSICHVNVICESLFEFGSLWKITWSVGMHLFVTATVIMHWYSHSLNEQTPWSIALYITRESQSFIHWCFIPNLYIITVSITTSQNGWKREIRKDID